MHIHADVRERISGREREVLERLLSGSSNKEIARDFGISHRTVEVHRKAMVKKLGARNSIELATMALIGVEALRGANDTAPEPQIRRATLEDDDLATG